VQLGTGLTIPLPVQSQELTEDFEQRLKSRRKAST